MRIKLTGEHGTVEIDADQRIPTGLISPHPKTDDMINAAVELYTALRTARIVREGE